MDFDNLKEKFVYYLDKGIVQDIYMSRLSYSLLMSIGKYGKQLEGTPYVLFFQNLQMILSDHLIVHITKLFEPIDKRYEVISVPTTLQIISENVDNLEIIERPLVCQHLANLGILLNNSWSITSAELNRIIVDHFQSTMPSLDNSNSLLALKVIRDKRIAHRELMDISGSPTTSFRDAYNLITYAQNFVIVVGTAYTSTVHGFINEDFFLGEDAERSSLSLKNIINDLLKISEEFVA
ncbi:MAG: hypothetical protein NTX44_11280 [Ignavibacteriales bacterium]|nr:hypothetical protein [Ignavibacteriales bacterium]